jgi:hypothetical protein
MNHLIAPHVGISGGREVKPAKHGARPGGTQGLSLKTIAELDECGEIGAGIINTVNGKRLSGCLNLRYRRFNFCQRNRHIPLFKMRGE